ncbi:MAG TPA: hypothetical protein VLL52_06855 [Anaerolineae bacterium]|nr:hypothetical protein [Anaerolineae bacterium]
MSDEEQVGRGEKRPLGVTVLTFYAIFAAVLVPLFVVTMPALFLSAAERSGLFSWSDLLLTILLAGSILVAAVKTWQGNNKARWLFLALVTVHYVLLGFNNGMVLLSGGAPAGLETRMMGRVFRGVFYPAVYIWYFNRPYVRAFFGLK